MKVFFVTCPPAEAEKIARHLVENGWAACANIVQNVRSIYRWQGKICDDAECLMIVKTARADIENFVAEVKKIHSYEVPEVIGFEITDANDDYLNWVIEHSGGK